MKERKANYELRLPRSFHKFSIKPIRIKGHSLLDAEQKTFLRIWGLAEGQYEEVLVQNSIKSLSPYTRNAVTSVIDTFHKTCRVFFLNFFF